MLFNFPKLVKQLLSGYSDYNYSVLNTRVFISCWLTFSLDASVTSMRGLFRKLNLGGKGIDQSTFSKANQRRSSQPFEDLYQSLNRLVKKKNKSSNNWDIGSWLQICRTYNRTIGRKPFGVMDRGFAGLPYFADLKRNNKPFVIRLSLNYKKVPLESGEWQVGTGKDSGVYRVVWFSDLERKVNYCLMTKLTFTVSHE